MSATPPSKPVPRAMVRLDEDLHEKLRKLAYEQKTSITRLVNDRVRVTFTFEEARIFNRSLNEVAAELETAMQQEKERQP